MNKFGPMWHPQTNLSTLDRDRLVITGGEGAWLTTEDGQRLLDLPASLWHANIGHGRARVAEAAANQMRTLETYHLFGGHAHRPAMHLAERLVAMLPMSEPSVFFTSGGSDSIDTACKLARRYWQLVGRPSKKLILSRTGGYHGLHGYGTSIAGLDFNREGYGAESLIPETARIPANDLAEATAIIERIGAENIAAVVVEPVIGTGGVIPPAEGYLEGLRALARANQIVFVADEVITGFGRLGHWFGSERWGLEPDMITMAKGMTSGYLPLGAVGIAGWLSEPFAEPGAPIFRHGLTYSGHATACAVAEANLDIIEEEGLVGVVAGLEPILAEALAPLAELPQVMDVRSIGLMAGIQLTPETNAAEVIRGCRVDGVLTRLLADNTLHICPPFVITADELRLAIKTLGAQIARLEIEEGHESA